MTHHSRTDRVKRLTKLSTVAALLLFGLAACDEAPTTVVRHLHSAGSLDFLIDATKNKGPLLLEISGSPYGESEGMVTRRVTAVLDNSLQIRPFTVTLLPGDADNASYHLRLVFNGPKKGQVKDRCTASAVGGSKAGERVDLEATFCRDGEVLSAVDGWIEKTQSVEDEKFAKLLHQVTKELFIKDANKR